MKKNLKHLLIISSTFLLIVIFTFKFTYPLINDTYYHMSVGREVAKTGKIPTRDNFVYSQKNTEYTSTEWLSGLMFYLIYDKWQENGLYLVRALAILMTLFFVLKSLRLFTNNYLTISTLILFLGLVLFKRLNARPEIISYAILAMINFICLNYYQKARLSKFIYLLPPIFLLWPSIHGFAPLGLSLLGFFSFLSLLKDKFSIKTKYTKIFLGIFVLSAVAALSQWKRFFFFLEVNNFSGFIIEWISLARRIFPEPTDPIPNSPTFDIISYLLIFPLYILTSVLFIKKEKNKTSLIVSLFYLLLLATPIKYYRLIQPMFLLSLPMIFLTVKKAFPNLKIKLLFPLVFTSLAAVYLLSFVFDQALFGPKRNIESSYGPRFKTIEFIDTYLDSKRAFAIGRWSDFFVWHLPGVKTFNDVMHQYRTKENFEDEAKLHDPKTDPDELLEKYDIDTIVNTSTANKWISKTSVENLPNWELVYIDTKSAVYARRDIVRKKPVDLSSVNPDSTRSADLVPLEIEQLKKLLEYDPENDFALRRTILYVYNERNEKVKAYEMAEAARKLLPKDPYFSYLLAVFSIAQSDCEKGRKFTQEAVRKSKYDPEMRKLTNPLIETCR